MAFEIICFIAGVLIVGASVGWLAALGVALVGASLVAY